MAFTFFFRDLQTIELAIDAMLPAVAGRTRVRVWDAGCAMGPEPYTLAIVLAEKMHPYAFRNLSILATDYETEFQKIVEDGIYPTDQLQRIPLDLFSKYFAPMGEAAYKVADEIRERITFRHHDLLSLKAPGEGFALILCKNVLLHFSPAQRIEVMKMYHSVLEPGGLLATEHTQELPAELEPLFEKLVGDARLYRKREKA